MLFPAMYTILSFLLALTTRPRLVISLTAAPKASIRLSAFASRGARAFVQSAHMEPSCSTEPTDAIMEVGGPPLPPVPPTSKRLFLVRHGEVINPGGDKPVYYGAMDVSLSPLGEEEAKAAAHYLSQFDLQHVATSPLSRAVFGAREVLESQGADGHDLIVNAGFTELDRGAWCSLTLEEIGKENMSRFDLCDESVTPKGGESFLTLKTRVLNARDELLDVMDVGKASALVSHLQVTRSMLSDAMDVPTERMVQLKVATASVTCIDYDVATGKQIVRFQSFKPDVGLREAVDGAN